jgi:hypothetical protein
MEHVEALRRVLSLQDLHLNVILGQKLQGCPKNKSSVCQIDL